MTIEELYEHVETPCSYCGDVIRICDRCGVREARDFVDAIRKHLLKYRWHDLRKDPTDLPTKEDEGYMVKQFDVVQPFSAYWSKAGIFVDDLGDRLSGIVAWREIEPFEEVEE